MYKINYGINALSPAQRKKVQKANLALALASHNQSFANLADIFANQGNQSFNADHQPVGENSKRSAKQPLIDEFVPRSSSRAMEPRGSSLFIRNMAELEYNERKSEG